MISPLQPKIAIPLNRYSTEPGLREEERGQKCLQNPHRRLEARWVWDENHRLQCQWVKVT
ncbi:MAG: hypothetical protein GC158_01110 [Cyanobacteria bacterium RI_101]|jgi:hypothetical protein|nr:hypothetical protein [Cyanobacteria bacterium RI_101]